MTSHDRTDPTKFYPRRDELVELLVLRNLSYAAKALNNVRPDDPTGVSQASLGLGFFLSEQYKDAEVWYGDAAALQSENEDWAHMDELAHANVVSAIHVPVPPVFHFQPTQLLAPPFVSPDALPAPPPPPLDPALPVRFERFAEEALGRLEHPLQSVRRRSSSGKKPRLSRRRVDHLVSQRALDWSFSSPTCENSSTGPTSRTPTPRVRGRLSSRRPRLDRRA